MEYYIDIERKKRNTAGAKAPDDIAELCERRGMKKYSMPGFPADRGKIYKRVWLLLSTTFYWNVLLHKVNEGDVILYQHPMYGYHIAQRFINKIQKKKKCRFVAVIHDLESLRKGIEGVLSANKTTNDYADNLLLKQFDKVICHNKHMKQYLVKQGFNESKLVCLEIFDYLNNSNRVQHSKDKKPSIAIAGNLTKGKSGYIYRICSNTGNLFNKNLSVHVYGNNYDSDQNCSQMIYHGSFKPEELPNHLEGDFGLVWDGPDVETCTGNTGEYLKYNNPHKTSLYLSSNMPVIVWSKAAIADFVLENNVGIVVDNLYELEEKISSISIEDYQSMCANVSRISKRLRNGYYCNKAMNEL